MRILQLGNGLVGQAFSSIAKNNGHLVTTVDPLNGNIMKNFQDLNNSDLLRFDILVNLLPSYSNQSLLEWLPLNRIPYFDFSTQKTSIPTEHMLYIHKLNARLSVANIGLGPGIVNLLFADLVDRGASWVEIFYWEDQDWFKPTWGTSEFRENLSDPVQYAENTDGSLSIVTLRDHKLSPHFYSKVKDSYYGSHEYFLCTADELYSLTLNYPNLNYIKIYAGGLEHLGEVVMKRMSNVEFDFSNVPKPPSRFSMLLTSDVGEHEIVLPSRPPLEFTPIAYYTALAGWIFINNIIPYGLEPKLYYPETLPQSLRSEILREFIVQSEPIYLGDLTREFL